MGSPLIPIYATPSVCVPWLQDSDEQAVEALGSPINHLSRARLLLTVCRTVALPLSASYRFRPCKSAATVQVAVGALPPRCYRYALVCVDPSPAFFPFQPQKRTTTSLLAAHVRQKRFVTLPLRKSNQFVTTGLLSKRDSLD